MLCRITEQGSRDSYPGSSWRSGRWVTKILDTRILYFRLFIVLITWILLSIIKYTTKTTSFSNYKKKKHLEFFISLVCIITIFHFYINWILLFGSFQFIYRFDSLVHFSYFFVCLVFFFENQKVMNIYISNNIELKQNFREKLQNSSIYNT